MAEGRETIVSHLSPSRNAIIGIGTSKYLEPLNPHKRTTQGTRLYNYPAKNEVRIVFCTKDSIAVSLTTSDETQPTHNTEGKKTTRRRRQSSFVVAASFPASLIPNTTAPGSKWPFCALSILGSTRKQGGREVRRLCCGTGLSLAQLL